LCFYLAIEFEVISKFIVKSLDLNFYVPIQSTLECASNDLEISSSNYKLAKKLEDYLERQLA